MTLNLKRYYDNGITTQGLLFIDGKFECYTLEDEYRKVKVAGETRIPDGTYEIRLREYGRIYEMYKDRFPGHKGALELIDVHGFTDILIHIGNYDDDTAGCILVGEAASKHEHGMILNSTSAYLALYAQILHALDKKDVVSIIVDTL